MKPSSGTLVFVRIFIWVIAITVAVGYFAHVRAQSGGLPEQGMVIPLRPLAPLSTVPVPPVFGMEGILADKTAAIQLGKALFWDMQAGSDDIQACASCHFNAGADSRAINQVNPGQAGGDNNFHIGVSANGSLGPNYHYKAGTAGAGFGGYHDGDFPFRKVADVKDRFSVISDVNDVSGSQGQFGLTNDRITVDVQRTRNTIGDHNPGSVQGQEGTDDGDNAGFIYGNDRPHLPGAKRGPANSSGKINSKTGSGDTKQTAIGGATVNTNSVEWTTSVADPVFSYPNQVDATQRVNVRRVTGRNTPSAVNAVFNFLTCWDVRAQKVCNGANPFGASDN
jgi:hypothetical protein